MESVYRPICTIVFAAWAPVAEGVALSEGTASGKLQLTMKEGLRWLGQYIKMHKLRTADKMYVLKHPELWQLLDADSNVDKMHLQKVQFYELHRHDIAGGLPRHSCRHTTTEQSVSSSFRCATTACLVLICFGG